MPKFSRRTNDFVALLARRLVREVFHEQQGEDVVLGSAFLSLYNGVRRAFALWMINRKANGLNRSFS